MTFGPDHYLAVLKLMEGERAALAQLSPAVAQHVMPLFEVSPLQKGDKLDDRLRRDFKGLRDGLRQFPVYMVDAGAMTSRNARSTLKIFNAFASLPGHVIPVLSLLREAEANEIQKLSRKTFAIRVARSEFETSRNLESNLLRFAKTLGGTKNNHLIVDLGETEDMLAVGIARMSTDFLRRVPAIDDWRTLSLISNCFPKSLRGVPSDHLIERSDFISWRDALQSTWKGRRPTFGDGGIQHGAFFEKDEDAIVIPTANIRYARERDWVVVKGVKANGADTLRNQMPQLASRLLASRQALEASHCAGCRDLHRAANSDPGVSYATSPAWRRIGAVHHITTSVGAIQRALGS